MRKRLQTLTLRGEAPARANMDNRINEFSFHGEGNVADSQGRLKSLDHTSEAVVQNMMAKEYQQASASLDDPLYMFAPSTIAAFEIHLQRTSMPAGQSDAYATPFADPQRQQQDWTNSQTSLANPAAYHPNTTATPAAVNALGPNGLIQMAPSTESALAQTYNPAATFNNYTEQMDVQNMQQTSVAQDPYLPFNPDFAVNSVTGRTTQADAGVFRPWDYMPAQGNQSHVADNGNLYQSLQESPAFAPPMHPAIPQQTNNLAAGLSLSHHNPAAQATHNSLVHPGEGINVDSNQDIKKERSEKMSKSGRASVGRRGQARPRAYEAGETAIIVAMYHAGKTVAQIAKCLDRPVLGIDHKIRRMKKGHELPPSPPAPRS